MIIEETLPALQMAKQMGKIRHIGLTGYPLSKMANIVANSHVKIDVVLSYCRGTLADGTLGSYMAFFQVRLVTTGYAFSLSNRIPRAKALR